MPATARPRPRGAADLRHRRARHARPSSPPPRPASRSPTTARGSGRCRRTSPTASASRSTTSAARRARRTTRLTQHFAGRLADAGLISEVTEQQVYSPADGRFLPDRYIEGTCPNCGYPRARGDQCENCTKQLDPTDLIEPRSAISGSTDLEVRETRHLYLRQSLMRDELRALDRDQDRLAGALDLDRAEVARRRRGPAGPRRSPATSTGASRSGAAPSPGPAWRARSSTSGSTRRSSTSAPPPNGRTPTASARPAGGAGGATDEGAADVRYVQFMGKDNVPFHTLSFPATILGSGRAVEARRLHQVLQLPELRGRQVLHLPGPRRLHGPGARDPARRLLALVADGERPRGLGFQLHLGELPGRGEQGPRRRARQLRQPRHQVRRRPLRHRRPRRRQPTAPTRPPSPPTSPAGSPPTRRTWRRSSSARPPRSSAPSGSAGNEYLQAAAPWTAIKTDPDRAAAITRFGLNLIRLYAVLSPPLPPRRLRRDARRARPRRRPTGRPTSPPRSTPCRPATRSPSPTCSSPSSTTRARRSSPPASPAAEARVRRTTFRLLRSRFL